MQTNNVGTFVQNVHNFVIRSLTSGLLCFKEYLKQLIVTGCLEKKSGSISLGITEQLLAGGFESLSIKQAQVFFEHVIGKLVIGQCKFCHGNIPWAQMLEALDNGNYCEEFANAHKEVLKQKATKKTTKKTRTKKKTGAKK
jgi:hypothetical protein